MTTGGCGSNSAKTTETGVAVKDDPEVKERMKGLLEMYKKQAPKKGGATTTKGR
jgi:hypothetical protein